MAEISILDTIKKNIKGEKYTDDYILGYLDAIADISGRLLRCQSSFSLGAYQERCREWAGKKKNRKRG